MPIRSLMRTFYLLRAGFVIVLSVLSVYSRADTRIEPGTFALATVVQSPSLSGIARDGEGKPLIGVRIVLTRGEDAAPAYQTTSDSSGEYHFVGMDTGKYTLVADLSGYQTNGPLAVQIDSASTSLTIDLKLMRSSSAQGSPRPKPEFQSTGIRGLIDPGGYSASTSSASSGLLRGIADVKRTDNRSDITDAKDWPCGLGAELQRAIAEHPEQEEANRKLGQFYVAHGQPAKAIPLLKRALQINGLDAIVSRELAIAHMQEGDFESARKVLLPLVETHADPDLHQLLARADEGSGMFSLAAQEYRSAESEAPSEESIFGEGYELILAGSITDAVAVLDDGVKMCPRSISLRIGLGAAQCLRGKTSEGLHSFLDAADIDPSDARPYSFLANASANPSDQSDRVKKSFERYFDREPDNGSASFFYALALSRENSAANTDRIEILLKRALQLDGNLAKAHLLLAETYARRNDYEQAVPEFEASVRLAQDSSEAHYRLALAYRHIGRSEQAAREMQLFELSKKSQTVESEGKGIGVELFISVMDSAGRSSDAGKQCPATSITQESVP
jgi:tetratricopeptide (TPR) repeat protein